MTPDEFAMNSAERYGSIEPPPRGHGWLSARELVGVEPHRAPFPGLLGRAADEAEQDWGR